MVISINIISSFFLDFYLAFVTSTSPQHKILFILSHLILADEQQCKLIPR